MELKLKAGQFYGKTFHALAADGFRFTEKSYASYTTLPTHAHELSHFCFVLAGNYQEHIGGKHFERAPTALVFYPPDVSHRERHFTSGRHLLVEIDFKSLERVRDYGACLSKPVLLANGRPLWLAAQMYREFTGRDQFSALILESLTTELLIATSRLDIRRAERLPPPWLANVKEFVRAGFSEPLRLSEIACAVNIHPTHLARVFRQFEHCTVGDYIRRVRINFACQRISGSNDALVDIALAAGFADQTHFNRCFKRLTGMTPTEFRRTFTAR